jgi:hypothetical protein
MTWTTPLEIYVIWDPESDLGKEVANSLFASFCGDPDSPLAHGPGIPVYYRSAADADGNLQPIPWSRARYTVLVVITDDKLVARKSKWRDWLENALDECGKAPDERRFFLIGISQNFTNLSRKISAAQGIRLVEMSDDFETLEVELLARLSNEISRIIDPARDGGATTLFLSHAKRDGRNVALQVKEHINNAPVGEVFFDEVSLQPTKGFESAFRKTLEKATLVVLMTDAWATRYWCQWEALQGKELDRPMLLVDMLSDGERRHFPYLGNTPAIRCDANTFEKADCRRIIAAAQLETLRDLHENMRMKELEQVERLPAGSRHLTRSPELASLVTMFSEESLGDDVQFVYPDPPIADHEHKLLQRFKEELQLATPIELLSGLHGGEQPLAGNIIAISISEPTDLNALGIGLEHLDRLWVALSQHLLAMGAGVAYGGDPRKGGYTEILLELVRAYADEGRMLDERMVHWYMAWPIHLKFDDEARAELPDVIDLHDIGKPADVNRDEKAFVPPKEDQYAWIRSLTEMRKAMVDETNARVLVGGQLLASTPRSGIVEEFTLSFKAKQPIYLCGGFGGMTADLIKAVLGETPESLTEDFQAATEDRRKALQEYNDSEAGKADPINYSELVNDFSASGIAGLNNGLDDEANKRLFESQSVEEIVGLVREGLVKKLKS